MKTKPQAPEKIQKQISEQEARIELHNDLTRQLVAKRLELDAAHLWEPLKKQERLCAELVAIEEQISLLEKRMEYEKQR